jgi:hypothetical protein
MAALTDRIQGFEHPVIVAQVVCYVDGIDHPGSSS